MEAIKPFERGLDTEDAVGHYTASGKEEILPLVTARVDLEDTMLNEISSKKTKNHMFSRICGIYN